MGGCLRYYGLQRSCAGRMAIQSVGLGAIDYYRGGQWNNGSFYPHPTSFRLYQFQVPTLQQELIINLELLGVSSYYWNFKRWVTRSYHHDLFASSMGINSGLHFLVSPDRYSGIDRCRKCDQ